MSVKPQEAKAAERLTLEDNIAKHGKDDPEAVRLLEGDKRQDFLESLIPYSGNPVMDARMVNLYRNEGFEVTENREKGGYVTRISREDQLARVERVRAVSLQRQKPRSPKAEPGVEQLFYNQNQLLGGMSPESFDSIPYGGHRGAETATEY